MVHSSLAAGLEKGKLRLEGKKFKQWIFLALVRVTFLGGGWRGGGRVKVKSSQGKCMFNNKTK